MLMLLEETVNEHGEEPGPTPEPNPEEMAFSGTDLFKTRNYGDQPLIVLFVFIALFVGAILREINKKTHLPFSVMLLYAGIMMGKYYP